MPESSVVDTIKAPIEAVGRGMESALNFFGIDFKTEEGKVRASQTPSKASEFFGQDFSTSNQNKSNAGNPSPLHGSFDKIFSNLIQAESGGVHADEKGVLTTSKKGAQGITQLMPSTAANPGFGITPVKDKSEEEYLRVGKEYLSKLYDRFGNWEQALAAYNSGLGNVSKAVGKAERFGGEWKEYLPKKEETLPYIKKILKDIQ